MECPKLDQAQLLANTPIEESGVPMFVGDSASPVDCPVECSGLLSREEGPVFSLDSRLGRLANRTLRAVGAGDVVAVRQECPATGQVLVRTGISQAQEPVNPTQ